MWGFFRSKKSPPYRRLQIIFFCRHHHPISRLRHGWSCKLSSSHQQCTTKLLANGVHRLSHSEADDDNCDLSEPTCSCDMNLHFTTSQMLLDGVSWLDIIVFVLFLGVELLLHSNIMKTVICALHAIPFVAVQLPLQIVRERVLTPAARQRYFTRRTTFFQDFLIRCIRWGFVNIPAEVGRCFFTKGVVLPFLRFRLLRMGKLRDKSFPTWREVHIRDVNGLWIQAEPAPSQPDIVVLYAHGGGFAMGSAYFYLEFLLSWVFMLREGGFRNPAIFALDYSLIPDQVYPTQLNETLAAYHYVLSTVAHDPNRVVVAGDSAGGLLILSLLLRLGSTGGGAEKPAFATLISPWTHLMSEENISTGGDFLDSDRLNEYGRIYAGAENPSDPSVSPGECTDMELWRAAIPSKGIAFYYGSEEVFNQNIKILETRVNEVGVVMSREDENVHAWPFAAMFLGHDKEERGKGLERICNDIRRVMWKGKGLQ